LGAQIEILLGDRIYSRDGEPLEVVLGDLLKQAHATVAVAESMTGGMLAERLTSVPGSSAYFIGGFITYSNAMKTEMVGVSEPVLATHGAVSRQTAEAMATGARRRTGATYGLAVTGIAGPEGDGGPAPVGTAFFGLASASRCEVMQRQFLGDRARVRSFAAQYALDLLRRKLRA
jgi:nicotinamide-nucleotide amidase